MNEMIQLIIAMREPRLKKIKYFEALPLGKGLACL